MPVGYPQGGAPTSQFPQGGAPSSQLPGGYSQYPTTSGAQIPSAAQVLSPGNVHFQLTSKDLIFNLFIKIHFSGQTQPGLLIPGAGKMK